MCHFVTAVLPGAASLPRLDEVAPRHGLRFAPVRNTFVESQLPEGSLYLEKLTSHCDCGTVLGSIRTTGAMNPGDTRREVARRRKAGWSEGKLARWLADKRKTERRREQQLHDRARDRQPEAGEWVAFLRDLLQGGAVASFGLLLHFYRKGPASERIELARSQRMSIGAVDEEALMRMEEDILYIFERAR